MSNAVRTWDNSSTELREERSHHQQAFWEYCVSNLRTIELACPSLYYEVNRTMMERTARAMGYPGRVYMPSYHPPMIDLDTSILSGEWPPHSTTGSGTSLISTLAPNEQTESELQEFYTAQESVPTEVGVDVNHMQDKSSPEVLTRNVHGGLGLFEPQPDVLHRPRILFELPTNRRQVSFLTEPYRQAEVGIKQSKVLGALHGYAEAQCTVEVGSIRVAIIFIPWKNDVLLINNSFWSVNLTSEPDRLGVLEIQPRKSATIDPGYWALRNDSTCLQFHLRPCSYHLIFQVETNKRAADNTTSPSKRVRVSSKHVHDRDEVPESDLAVIGKSAVRRVSTVEVDSLASFGVPIGHTLAIVDNVTGDAECSIKRLGSWFMERKHAVLFKAILRKELRSKSVMVKIHKPRAGDIDSTQQAIQCWKREVKMHRGLQHACIASLVAFDARLLSIAIELKDAYDLSSPSWCYTRRSRKAGFFKGTIDDAYRICADVASALDYLEEKRTVHDDIKAAIILYSKQGGATLIDFGLGHSVDEGRVEMGGSPWYKDPEFRDNGRSTSGDIFSLGVVMLYVMGELPVPEREPGWVIHDACRSIPEALDRQRAWISKVKGKRDGLQTSLGCGSDGKEAKLRSLVRKMLAGRNDRISAGDLAKETQI